MAHIKTIALVGYGNLGKIIAKGIEDKLYESYKIIGIYDKFALDILSENETRVDSISELLALNADIIIEAATTQTLQQIALPAMESGSDIIALSSGALADKIFYDEIDLFAKEHGRKFYVVSGAIGGFDIMQAAAFFGEVEASITTVKSPASLEGAPFLEGKTLSQTESELIFTGNTIEAIEAFPKNVNVSVAMSLATECFDKAMVKVISDPLATSNVHTIELANDLVNATIQVNAQPSKENKRSSALAAYSVLAKLKNLASGISLC